MVPPVPAPPGNNQPPRNNVVGGAVVVGQVVVYIYPWWCSDCERQVPTSGTKTKCSFCDSNKKLFIACRNCKEYVPSKKTHGKCSVEEVTSVIIIVSGRARFHIPADFVLVDPYKYICKICRTPYKTCPKKKKVYSGGL